MKLELVKLQHVKMFPGQRELLERAELEVHAWALKVMRDRAWQVECLLAEFFGTQAGRRPTWWTRWRMRKYELVEDRVTHGLWPEIRVYLAEKGAPHRPVTGVLRFSDRDWL